MRCKRSSRPLWRSWSSLRRGGSLSKGRRADAAALSELEATTKQLGEAFATKRTELGSLEQQVKNDDEREEASRGWWSRVAGRGGRGAALGTLEGADRVGGWREVSRFAQSLTLRQLIGLANEHLKVLAERYRLMAAEGDELDLRIVDLYQANVDRPMESLSGGESFLASLALALGLSELASRHHPIDSLFIDEGFGTLDSETLEVALSALENLRAGRLEEQAGRPSASSRTSICSRSG
jgi:exonuclease SbcC